MKELIDERYIPCPFCNKKFASDEFLKKHIKTSYRQGHKNKKCSNCCEPLSRCKDIDAVGQAFACEHKEKNKC